MNIRMTFQRRMIPGRSRQLPARKPGETEKSRHLPGAFGAALLAAILFAGCTPEPVSEGSPPAGQVNFLFILLDDVGWNQVGYHGTRYYETPNIDSIAREGMQFSDAYSAAPICSPTRASIMTGRYPARLHLTDYIPGNFYPYNKVLIPEWTKYLPLEEVTIAEALKEKGYVTASFGKWHLNKDKDYEPGRPMDPASQGFDDVYTSVKPDDDADPNSDPHHVRRITDNALRFLDENRDRPFFLYVSHHVVHTPLIEREEFIAKYRNKEGAGLPENNPVMGAMIENTDNSIGELLEKLDELGLAESTMVILYSDNGGKEDEQDQVPLRGGKSDLYEGGIRVPLAIRWPGFVAGGSRSAVPVTSVDFFPTLLEVAGIPPGSEELDGESLVPVLKQTGGLEREAIYFHYPHYHHFGGKPSSAIREGDYKLIEWFDESLRDGDHPVTLYNLRADISEEHDLAAEMPEKTQELWDRLKKWRQDVGAQVPAANPDFDPAKEGTRR